MQRDSAVALIRGWAEEAEHGNCHDFSAVLSSYARIIEQRSGREELTVIRSYDAYPPASNIEQIRIDP